MTTAAELLAGRRVCVCAGSGGVGKTTTAAALALGMAARGLRVAVLTIDPARRLAASLGLPEEPELRGEERRVDPARLAAAGLEVRGELWASTLDAKRTWDDVVGRYAPDAATRETILANPIYRELSNAVAGTQEYMAMEKLYEMHETGGYDLLVLDTPPTRNALDFLDAPARLTRFMDSSVLKLFLAPGRTSLKLLTRPTGVLFTVLKRVTGIDLLRDLSDFFGAFGALAEGLQRRAERVEELLSAEDTGFVVVASPERDPIDEAIFFRRRLRDSGMPFAGAVVNRVNDDPGVDLAALSRPLGAAVGDATAARVAASIGDQSALHRRDRASIARLEEELRGEPLLLVPQLDEEVHDLAGLGRMAGHLFGAPAPAAAYTGVP